MTRPAQRIVNRTAMVFAGVVWAFAGPVMAQEMKLAEDVGDLSHAKVIEVRDSKDASVLCGQLKLQPADKPDELEREAEMLACGEATKATGEAELEVKKTATGLEQEVEVEVEHLVPNAAYTSHIDKKLVGKFQTDGLGEASVELKTTPKVAKAKAKATTENSTAK